MIESSGEARAEAPTATSRGDQMLGIVSAHEPLCLSVHIDVLPCDRLPPECRTEGTFCGSYGTTDGLCRFRRDQGCLLLRLGREKLVAGGEEVPA